MKQHFAAKYTRESSNFNRCSFCIESTQGAKNSGNRLSSSKPEKLTLWKNSDDFDVVIPSRSLREFSAVFTDDIRTVEIFFANNQSSLEAKILASIHVC